MTAQLHAQAVLDRLRTHGSPVITVHDGQVPDGALPPYALVRFTFRYLTAADQPSSSNLSFESRALETTARVYAVGASAQSARAIYNRAAVALLNWSPTVAGRSCSPIRQIDSFDTPADESTGVDYFEAGADYRFTSIPA